MALLIALLIIVPLIELWVIIEIGSLIGAVPTILLLLSFSVAGGLLVRREGRAAWSRLTETIGAGRIPARETADGVLVVTAGALLLTPGFITDLCGLMLLTPQVRAAVRGFALNRVVGGGWRGFAFAAAAGAGGRAQRRRGAPAPAWDVDGTVVEGDPPELPRQARDGSVSGSPAGDD